VDPPGQVFLQMEFLNCLPVSQLRSFNPEPTLLVYPNPSKDQIKIKIELKQPSEIYLRLVNVFGATVLERKYQGESGNNVFDLDLSGLEKGIYFINLKAGKTQISQKLMKQ